MIRDAPNFVHHARRRFAALGRAPAGHRPLALRPPTKEGGRGGGRESTQVPRVNRIEGEPD